ncbi:hypothetical protein TWF506_010625 [Arthrobotrys conoides]|uniref:Uncharacterized protein n=1 Tax=Arthrobotrys conoides TaxID=74498 RepID=A0AAN8N6Q8_9PEZI
MRFPPMTPFLSLRCLFIFLLVTCLSNAQIPPEPGSESNTGASTAPTNVDPIRREGEFVYIRLDPEFDSWVLANENILAALNNEVNSFAEIRAKLCPLGINPKEKQTTYSGRPIPQTPHFAFGYLIFAFKGEIASLFELQMEKAVTEGPNIPEWLQIASRVWKLPPVQAQDVMIKRRDLMGHYATVLESHWEALDKIDKKDFNNTLAFFPQPAEFGETLNARRSRMLVLLRSIFGGLHLGPGGLTAMINLKNFGFKADKWNKRNQLLEARVEDAELWAKYAEMWGLGDPDMTKVLGYYRYFPIWEPDIWTEVLGGKQRKKSTALTLFEDIWAWYGCWAAAWDRIVRIIDQLTPPPGLEDLKLEWAPEPRAYTTGDLITDEELMLKDIPEDPKLAALYMEWLLRAEPEDLDTIPVSDNQDQVQMRYQWNMQDLMEVSEENNGGSNPQTEARRQDQDQTKVENVPQSHEQPQEVEFQPEVQVQPQVQIQEEPEEVQMIIELGYNQNGISAANTEAVDVSDLSSRRSRPGGKSRARMNRKSRTSEGQMEEEY